MQVQDASGTKNKVIDSAVLFYKHENYVYVLLIFIFAGLI